MKRLAIIGGGISGLACAYYLKEHFQITLYEANHFGGHAHTIPVNEQNRIIPIDIGFIVFNHITYPHFTQLLKDCDVPIAPSKMSFGVSINQQLEYGSASLNNWFAQRKQLVNPRMWQMTVDILRFNRLARHQLATNAVPDVTLADYLQLNQCRPWLIHHYLIPMGAAIWSTAPADMLRFPAINFLRFFANHGLLAINNPIQWFTIRGGSQCYVKRLLDRLRQHPVTLANTACQQVIRHNTGITVISQQGQSQPFDAVIFATHSDQALQCLQQPTAEEVRVLSAIKYRDNRIVLHTDQRFMPQNRRAWSSWIYLAEHDKTAGKQLSLSYWMNELQPLNTDTQYFVSVNPDKDFAENTIISEQYLAHPQFDHAAITAQQQLQALQGNMHTYYCGAYCRYGFHEDGVWSAVQVAKKLGVTIARP